MSENTQHSAWPALKVTPGKIPAFTLEDMRAYLQSRPSCATGSASLLIFWGGEGFSSENGNALIPLKNTIAAFPHEHAILLACFVDKYACLLEK
jgi:hypothetical protein